MDRVTLFTPEAQWTEAAELPGVSGHAVAGLLLAFYGALAVLAFWPTDRQAMGEVYSEKPGEWKTDDE